MAAGLMGRRVVDRHAGRRGLTADGGDGGNDEANSDTTAHADPPPTA
jgi:hypothetical protein